MTLIAPGSKGHNQSTCPVCQSGEVVPIEYGLPGPDILRASVEGRILLGGCCVTGSDPNKYCSHCGYKWREQKKLRIPSGHDE